MSVLVGVCLLSMIITNKGEKKSAQELLTAEINEYFQFWNIITGVL